jgi:hypothetical protein
MASGDTLTIHLLEGAVFVLVMALICLIPLLMQTEKLGKESSKPWDGNERRKP